MGHANSNLPYKMLYVLDMFLQHVEIIPPNGSRLSISNFF